MTNRLSQLRVKLDHMGKIARDESGNIVWITAFALFPMMGLIGSGVDMSRAYMAKTRLQAACDAGALAGRKAMGDTGTYNLAAQSKANRMFNFNFDKASNGAETVSFVTQTTSDSQVTGSATASIKTTVMRMFNKPSITVVANCEAELQLASADVMFVLDSTGSMACAPADTVDQCQDWINDNGYTEKSDSRMKGLREAIRDFHSTLAGAITNTAETRIRYGFVPYSSAVNVKQLIADSNIPKSYLVDSAPYQTRVARFTNPSYSINVIRKDPTVSQSKSFSDKNLCQSWYNNSGDNPEYISGSYPTALGQSSDIEEYVYDNGSWNKSSKTCSRDKTRRRATYTLAGYNFKEWVYTQDVMDVSNFKNGSVAYANGRAGTVLTPGDYDLLELLNAPGATGMAKSTAIWDGCIEERKTVRNQTMNPVPGGATDLDIISAPTSDDTKWVPMFDDIMFNRTDGTTQEVKDASYNDNSKPNYYCPDPMVGFKTADMSSTTVPTWLETFITGLNPTGGTYHDIGMIWGGRLSSQRGINKTNVNAGNLNSVSRHIIFMTDGQMDPGKSVYSSYGVERFDNRVAPPGTTSTQLQSYHNGRFLAACRAAKAEGYMVWVIGFGTTVSDEMMECSSDRRAYESSDTNTLKTRFRYIATQIADLRLSQ